MSMQPICLRLLEAFGSQVLNISKVKELSKTKSRIALGLLAYGSYLTFGTVSSLNATKSSNKQD